MCAGNNNNKGREEVVRLHEMVTDMKRCQTIIRRLPCAWSVGHDRHNLQGTTTANVLRGRPLSVCIWKVTRTFISLARPYPTLPSTHIIGRIKKARLIDSYAVFESSCLYQITIILTSTLLLGFSFSCPGKLNALCAANCATALPSLWASLSNSFSAYTSSGVC